MLVLKEYHCEICGEYLGKEPDVSNIECAGEKCSIAMGAYYGRREHYERFHKMDDEDARNCALTPALKVVVNDSKR